MKAVKKDSSRFILAGPIRQFQPTLPASAKLLADERYRKRRQNLTDETLNDPHKLIHILLMNDKRAKLQFAVGKCDRRTSISYLWRLIKGLSGKKTHNSHSKGIWSADTTFQDPKVIENKCANKFTPPPTCQAGDSSKRQLKLHFH